MSFMVIVGGLFGLLFLVSYVTKRRFGTVALALAAGAMMSTLWVQDLTPVIARSGVVLVQPPLETVVAVLLTLLPALLLLFSGPVVHEAWRRLIGALVFAVLAITLLLDPLSAALVIEGPGRTVHETILAYKASIVTVCLCLALLDILITKFPKHSRSGSKH